MTAVRQVGPVGPVRPVGQVRLLIVNAGQIVTMASKGLPEGPRRGKSLTEVGLLGNGHAVLIKDGSVAEVGLYNDLKGSLSDVSDKKVEVLDAQGKVVLPGFVDSHTHAVFGASRIKDFELRLKGLTYKEIAEQGGGIRRSVADLRAADDQKLAQSLEYWSQTALRHGTTTMEVKSGYGLDIKQERRILLAVKEAQTPLELVPTFLGAHAIPDEFKNDREGYIREVCRKMLPEMKPLAKFCDVFCEEGYFSREEARRILLAAQGYGYGLKVHAEQLRHTGGAYLGYRLKAASVDHLDCITEGDMKFLAQSNTIATLLPGSNFFLATKRYPPARKMIEQGLAVGLASDFNPGTCPTLNMGFVMSLAVTQMKMTPQEALTAATINGAYALNLAGRTGSIEPGKQADLIAADVKDYREIPYYFAMNMIRGVVKKGETVFWN
ncbi:MAG: imidazolonepropionase [Elusimicrobia bacterium]|nr:imidazolonepropionase [Elusimicrobiota bacterium]